MNQIVVRMFLVAYCLLVAEPALPFAADLAAHVFWSEHHHEHHHHEHGHDHVHEEVKKAVQEEQSPVKKSTAEKETLSVHINPEFDYKIDFVRPVAKDHITIFISHYSHQGTGVITPPPRV